jgi:5'-nucleotidase
MKPTILLTNDDGYQSIGFYPLLSELSKDFSVTAVVPSGPRSWIGKSISAHEEVTIDKHRLHDSTIYLCSGTPADCVQIGLYDILKVKPACVVSGINIGVNIGHGRILSSGTIGAAMEAAIDGVFAISSSYHIPSSTRAHTDFFDQENYSIFENAAQITHKFVQLVLSKELPKDIDIVTLNIPYEASADTSLKIAKPFRQPYGQLFQKTGNAYTHREPNVDLVDIGIPEEGSDLNALLEGHISVTPINLELSSKNSISVLEKIIIPDW